MKVNQAYVQPELAKKFKHDFLSRWNFSDHSESPSYTSPCFFFGLGGNSAEKIKHYSTQCNHEILLHPVSLIDAHNFIKKNKDWLVRLKNVYIMAGLNGSENRQFQSRNRRREKTFAKIPENIVVKGFQPELKDMSLYRPQEKGDKIYYHSTWRSANPQEMSMIEILKESVSYEFITTNHESLADYFDYKTLKRDYYDKCFLNLNFSAGGSMLTAKELGYMGVKTIAVRPRAIQKEDFSSLRLKHFSSTRHTVFDFYRNQGEKCLLRPSCIQDIIDMIHTESKTIGDVSPQIKAIFSDNEEWLDMHFWKSDFLKI